MIDQEFLRRCKSNSDIADHLYRLYEEASRPCVKVLELGVRGGDSTSAFLKAILEQKGELWSVDIFEPSIPAEWRDIRDWYLTIGDDLDVADSLPDSFHVLFIDTSHTYDQTLAELNLYGPKVKPGGVIICHDTELERPEASPSSDPAFPVAEAIKEWSKDRSVVIDWVTGCWGLAVIYIPVDSPIE